MIVQVKEFTSKKQVSKENEASKRTKTRFRNIFTKGESTTCRKKNQHQTHKLKLYMRFTIKCSKNIKITVGIAKGHVGTKVRLPHETLKGDYFKQ